MRSRRFPTVVVVAVAVAAILAVATETGLCWKPRMTAVTVIGDSPQDVLAITALFEIVWNPSEPEPLRERAGEVLESLR